VWIIFKRATTVKCPFFNVVDEGVRIWGRWNENVNNKC
jgi:hypothetical protein